MLFLKSLKLLPFDNGSEFSRHKDIEKKSGDKERRTVVYFGRPYRSCDRASIENCNCLVRYFVKKGTEINTLDKSFIFKINKLINNKNRKILGYLSAYKLFLDELLNISANNDKLFYDFA